MVNKVLSYIVIYLWGGGMPFNLELRACGDIVCRCCILLFLVCDEGLYWISLDDTPGIEESHPPIVKKDGSW